MKYFVSIVFVFAALIAQAQTNIPKLYTPKQQWNNNLKMLSPDLQNSETAPVHTNTPALQLKNEGVKVGSNNLGDVYSMNVDKMTCLKPFVVAGEITDAIKK